MSYRYRLFREAVILLFGKALFGVVLHGEDRAPRRGPLIVASNHLRYIDPILVCMAVPRRIQWLAKKELFVPGLQRFFAFIGAFPVDRRGSNRSALRTARRLLGEGAALGIFPEGTHRQDEGVSREAKSGVARLAASCGAPVLPVYISSIPTPLGRLRGDRMHAYVGDPIDVDSSLRGKEAYRAASEEILRYIYALPEERLERS